MGRKALQPSMLRGSKPLPVSKATLDAPRREAHGDVSPRPALFTAKKEGMTLASAALDMDEMDERQLYHAIKVLDSCGKQLIGSQPRENMQSNSEQSVRKALSFLLQMTSPLNIEFISNPTKASKQRQSVATACTSRVLGCLKRFIAVHRNRSRSSSLCCTLDCHNSIVTLALLLLLFTMSKFRQIAKGIVAEGLEQYLLEVAQEDTTVPFGSGESTTLCPIETIERTDCESFEHVFNEPVHPEDLFCAIDPFDWCSQSISLSLAGVTKESVQTEELLTPEDIYLLPIGPRTVCYLLENIPLPADEIQEHTLRMQMLTKTWSSCSYGNKVTHHPRKPHRLPSIFEFSINKDEARDHTTFCFDTMKLSQRGKCDLTERAWCVVLNPRSRLHLVLRCLIALASRLPERSPERRRLIELCHHCSRKIYDSISVSDRVIPSLILSHEETSHLHQRRAISTLTLRRLAKTAQTMSEQYHKSTSEREAPTDNDISGLVAVNADLQRNTTFELLIRLESAQKQAQCEYKQWQARNAANASVKKAEYCRTQRHRIFKAILAIEELRESLARGLDVLRTGRQRPDPTQSFENWINSLPTIESQERERQLEMEMRQRQILEQQYQLEARRRRERSERESMENNDSDVAIDEEIVARSYRALHFVEMQTELRELEGILEDEPQTKEVIPSTAFSGANNCSSSYSATNRPLETDKLRAKQEREANERARIQLIRQEEQQTRERALMHNEDLYFAEQALRAQERARRQSEIEAEQHRLVRQRQLEAQERKIADMREREREAKQSLIELDRMRLEEHFSRQLRFFLAEQAKMERQAEQAARKRMAAEEHESRLRWQIIQRAAEQEEAAKQRRDRAEERRRRHQKKQVALDQSQRSETAGSLPSEWIQCWDDAGNTYYYNSQTGVSQWEPPGHY